MLREEKVGYIKLFFSVVRNAFSVDNAKVRRNALSVVINALPVVYIALLVDT